MGRVVLNQLTKRFGEFVAVDCIDLEVCDKEFLVLVGPSGCGKTTTLRMVAGLEESTEGEIYIGDELVNDLEPKDRNIAMVFQNYALYPHMNVRRNMAFGLKLRRVDNKEIERRVQDAAQILGIEPLLDRIPKELSGGQKQRVALGRAVVRRPDVFLFDEPLSNLDAKLRVGMRSELSKLHRRLEATIIYVTHDQVEAMTLGDRIVVMKDGRIQQVGSPGEVYYRPSNRFVASFIGSPAMSFFRCLLVPEEAGLSLDLNGIRLALSVDDFPRHAEFAGKEVIAGIRPEDLTDIPPPDGSAGNFQPAPALVEVVENLGPEVILDLSLAGQPAKARVKPETTAKVTQEITVFINMDRIHLFDAQTKESIK